jgi:hypothetical protein
MNICKQTISYDRILVPIPPLAAKVYAIAKFNILDMTFEE